MMKDLINIEMKNLPISGLDVHIIKKYIVKTAADDSFLVNNYSIILIKSGQFKIRLSDFTQELLPHDLLVIPKNSFCTIMEVKGRLQLLLLSFTSDFAFENCLKKELVDSFNFLLGEPSSKIALGDKDFLVLSLIYKLICFVNKDAVGNGQDLELQRISFNLFLYELKFIFNRSDLQTQNSFTRQEGLTIKFLTILTIHCKKQHSAKFYAGVLFVTRGYLNRTVKQITGKTVKSLIDVAIINEIKNLLENSQSSIAVIGQDFEFSNLANFSAFFRKHTSLSPSEYRQKTVGRFKTSDFR
ncbi:MULTISPECIES: helix-turn-helix domain-containing protein [Flavobacterium]|uniref:AraC-like DNA-binding protein n=1 Tax=Flavobacterium cutihirudinis TaxID=1265740 RepID=A0A3D9G1C7_9FLAO|nr:MULTISPECIES: helix-turn-helix domain-containing protein [Flavobacterium]MBZ4040954.1 helix-turn-helix domain-containing protein [Flavobacterium hibisci]RED27018.1 AraC-like DNA-binding protein [Flavobacterium cutihirudinis]